jgi:lipopolysaccharide/colanic/teichoic acid biosynthesis glycosyltransferase
VTTWEAAQRLVAAAALTPAMAIASIAALLIQFSGRGPVLVCQQREGYQGRPFRMYKLRTMVPDADIRLEEVLSRDADAAAEWQAFGRLKNDPRIPGAIAKLVRRCSIDELPQLINVVLGDMNLIGPRPLPAVIARCMRDRDREARRTLRPGITGLWQVTGRSDRDIAAMGRIDRIYVKNRSLALDVWILTRTPVAVVSRRGAY